MNLMKLGTTVLGAYTCIISFTWTSFTFICNTFTRTYAVKCRRRKVGWGWVQLHQEPACTLGFFLQLDLWCNLVQNMGG